MPTTKVKRSVRLQVRIAGNWTNVASGKASRRGVYALKTPAPAAPGVVSWRVKAPRAVVRTAHRKVRYKVYVSPVATSRVINATTSPTPIPSPSPTATPTATPTTSAAAPSITSVAPASGTRTGTTPVVLDGAGLDDVTEVRFGGVTATNLQRISSTQLRLTAPAALASGAVDVVALGPGGASAVTATTVFNYLDPSELHEGQSLLPGQSLRSPKGTFQLVMQGDGNLVLYSNGGIARWSTATQGGGNWAVLQGDGNFVLYDPAHRAQWSSLTPGFGTTRLTLQDDGNLVVYAGDRALWSTNGGTVYDRLVPGQRLMPGEVLRSPSRNFWMIMQGDGNLVVYNDRDQAQWSTSTHGAGNWAVMQEDGNFVLYAANNSPLWKSDTAGQGGALVRLQDDGNLVVYKGVQALWSRLGAAGNPAVDSFVERWNGKYVDVDGYPTNQPFQCTDLFNKFHMEVMGGSYVLMGGNGGAKNLWNTANAQMLSWYTKVGPDQAARKGDVAVWTDSQAAGAGHVAIVLADTGSTLTIFSQNPGASRVITGYTKSYLLGYFRPSR